MPSIPGGRCALVATLITMSSACSLLVSTGDLSSGDGAADSGDGDAAGGTATAPDAAPEATSSPEGSSDAVEASAPPDSTTQESAGSCQPVTS
ncbi:MAG TPA: hypothetical protein VGI39_29925, partial [Polyangiaceae bacterium]